MRFPAPTVLAVVCLAVASACSGAPATDASTTLERITSSGVLRVGYANEAPYAYMDREQGALTGEAPEIAKHVAEALGVSQVEGVLTEFGSLIPGLQAGRFDVIAAGMYITPERCEQVLFSNPTYAIGEAFVVRAGNPLGLGSYADVAAHETATLGVVAGTVERGYARDTGVPDDRVTVFPDPPSAVAGVKNGLVDAFAGTSLTIATLLERANDPALAMADPFEDPVIDGETIRGYGAFAFRKADTALRAAFNGQLATLLGTETHLALVNPFGFGRHTLPGDVTAAQRCAAQ